MNSTSSTDSIYFRNGIDLEELVQKYDLHGVQKLLKNNMIYIDTNSRVFLTDKGKVTQQFGFDKLKELENLEKKILKTNYLLWNLKNSILYFSMIILIIVLALIAIK